MRNWIAAVVDSLFFRPTSPSSSLSGASYSPSKGHSGSRKFSSNSIPLMISRFCHSEAFFALRVVMVCIVWYGCSSASNVVTKTILNSYPFYVTVTLSSLVNNAIYAIPLARIMKVKIAKVNSRYLIRTIGPIAAVKSLASVSAYFGLGKVPISYAQTVKATLPVFTILASRIMLREQPSKKVYLSVLPIVTGVVIASFTEMSFNLAGLLASLFSTFLGAFINVFIKKVFEDTGMHPISLLSTSAQIGAIVLFPIWLLSDGLTIAGLVHDPHPDYHARLPDLHFLFLLCLSGLCSFLTNLCGFALIHQLTALSYAVCNATKRIAIIVISLIFFRNPVNLLNCAGMLLAIIGMFVYNRVRHPLQAEEDKKLLRKRGLHSLDIGNLTSSESDAQLLLSTA